MIDFLNISEMPSIEAARIPENREKIIKKQTLYKSGLVRKTFRSISPECPVRYKYLFLEVVGSNYPFDIRQTKYYHYEVEMHCKERCS